MTTEPTTGGEVRPEDYDGITEGPWTSEGFNEDREGTNLPLQLDVRLNGSHWDSLVSSVRVSDADAKAIEDLPKILAAWKADRTTIEQLESVGTRRRRTIADLRERIQQSEKLATDLAAENERLREALKQISDKRTHAGMWEVGEEVTQSYRRMYECYDIADAALSPQASEQRTEGAGDTTHKDA